MEQVLLLLLFVLVALGSYLLRRLTSRRAPPSGGEYLQRTTTSPRQRSRPREEERQEPVALPPRWPSRPPEDAAERLAHRPSSARSPGVGLTRVATALSSAETDPAALPSTVPAGRVEHPRFGRPADLRQAIVLMAVLGPCRGVEPDEASRRP